MTITPSTWVIVMKSSPGKTRGQDSLGILYWLEREWDGTSYTLYQEPSAMVPQDRLKEYLQYIEWQLLLALERRILSKKAEVTAVITEAICNLGIHYGYKVSLESGYSGITGEPSNSRCDVLWEGKETHIWEIDRSIKERSFRKLSGTRPYEKLWVLWVNRMEPLSLPNLAEDGINLLPIGADICELVWDRLKAERELKKGLQHILSQKHRYHKAIRLSDSVDSGKLKDLDLRTEKG